MNGKVVFTWRRLDDPRTYGGVGRRPFAIGIHANVWHKIITKHFAPRERSAWDDWLGPHVTQRFNGGNCQDSAVFAAASEQMRPAIAASLSTPRVIQYLSDPKKERAAAGKEHWNCALPNGARLVLVALPVNPIAYVKTCFFGNHVLSLDPTVRWRREVRAAVEGYAGEGPKGAFSLPNPDDETPRQRPGSDHWNCRIRFLTPEIWGFHSATPGARWRMPIAYEQGANWMSTPLRLRSRFKPKP